nr:nucleotidyltransferase [Deinobacterium chartae]
MDAGLDEQTRAFYRRSLEALRDAGVRYMVGGAYAFAQYTGIERHTKDLDVYLCEPDVSRALRALEPVGCQPDHPYPHWLAKAYCGELFVDLIYSSGNGIGVVDEAWFRHARTGVVMGVPVLLVPPEELLWHKAFVQERERYDGADVAHLLRAQAESMDWPRLLRRFGPFWRVLYAHLVLFGFVYPGLRDRIPTEVMRKLAARLEKEVGHPASEGDLCQGTLLSRAQYLPDVELWGDRDVRLEERVRMTEQDVEIWTAAIDREEGPPGDPEA